MTRLTTLLLKGEDPNVYSAINLEYGLAGQGDTQEEAIGSIACILEDFFGDPDADKVEVRTPEIYLGAVKRASQRGAVRKYNPVRVTPAVINPGLRLKPPIKMKSVEITDLEILQELNDWIEEQLKPLYSPTSSSLSSSSA